MLSRVGSVRVINLDFICMFKDTLIHILYSPDLDILLLIIAEKWLQKHQKSTFLRCKSVIGLAYRGLQVACQVATCKFKDMIAK